MRIVCDIAHPDRGRGGIPPRASLSPDTAWPKLVPFLFPLLLLAPLEALQRAPGRRNGCRSVLPALWGSRRLSLCFVRPFPSLHRKGTASLPYSQCWQARILRHSKLFPFLFFHLLDTLSLGAVGVGSAPDVPLIYEIGWSLVRIFCFRALPSPNSTVFPLYLPFLCPFYLAPVALSHHSFYFLLSLVVGLIAVVVRVIFFPNTHYNHTHMLSHGKCAYPLTLALITPYQKQKNGADYLPGKGVTAPAPPLMATPLVMTHPRTTMSPINTVRGNPKHVMCLSRKPPILAVVLLSLPMTKLFQVHAVF